MDPSYPTTRGLTAGSLPKRMITGMVLVALILTAIWTGGLGILVLTGTLTAVALTEYVRLIEIKNVHPQKWPLHILSLILLLTTWLIIKQLLPLYSILLALLTVPVLFGLELFRNKENPFQNVSLTILGILWITAPFCLFLLCSYWPFAANKFNPGITIGYFMILWLGDTAAYITGHLYGKRKLFERISPGKTWAGSIGGLVLACMAGLINYYVLGQLDWSQWLLWSVIIYISGTFGDFTKSMLKRSVGVKDAGTILPGHGGVLDRFDSLIGSAPFAFLYLLLYA